MIKIKLRHYYPHYTSDVYIEVPDDIAIELHTFENEDAAFRMRRSRNRAFYSLDREDGLEREMQNSAPSSEDSFFREHLTCSLFSALRELPIAQARRIYAHYILGMSNLAIARVEGVNEGNVRKSVSRGLRRLQKNPGEFHD
ncbi:MAG: sigma factor-like helix-turn-helix DNA-binding protein [Clostridia bacterium]